MDKHDTRHLVTAVINGLTFRYRHRIMHQDASFWTDAELEKKNREAIDEIVKIATEPQRKGGAATKGITSERKKSASAANGAKGGRPRKQT